MSKSSTVTALAVVNSSELAAKDKALDQLQHAVITQLNCMRTLRQQESLRGLFVGMSLHRIKASLPYGKFGKWVDANIASFGDRYINYLMRLALVFVEKCKVKKPEILSLPGEQTELALDNMEGEQRRFMEKALKFTGDLSLNELFIKHDIKTVGLKKELAAQKAEDDKAAGEAGEQPPARTAQELCMDILEQLALARKDACDRAVWMQMSRAQHDDIKAAFENAAAQIAALHAQTHGRAARANRKPQAFTP